MTKLLFCHVNHVGRVLFHLYSKTDKIWKMLRNPRRLIKMASEFELELAPFDAFLKIIQPSLMVSKLHGDEFLEDMVFTGFMQAYIAGLKYANEN